MTAFTTNLEKVPEPNKGPNKQSFSANRYQRRHPLPKHNKRGFTKPKKKK